MKKNEHYTIKIDDLTKEGFGIGRADGFTLFVNGTLPEDVAEVKVVKVNKSFGYGKLIKLVKSTPYRREPACDIFFKCGGCSLQNLDYKEQLKLKKKIVTDALIRVGKLKDVEVNDVIGMENPYFYRNKAQFPVREKNGETFIGFYAPRTHEVIPVKKCYIQSEKSEEILEVISAWIKQYNISAYNEETQRGVLRNIFIRTGEKSGEIMVGFIINSDNLPFQKEIAETLAEKIPEIKSVIVNINKENTNVIMGKRTEAIYGESYIYDYIGVIKFKISAESFYQVNPKQTEVLYSEALEFASLSGNENFLDLYCGIGTISLFFAGSVKKSTGIEIVGEAVQNAKENAEINDIKNAEFFEGKAEELISRFKEKKEYFDVIAVDPPRKGCDAILLENILEMLPEKIIYISCDPVTLARDLRILCDSGRYTVKNVQPVDMFPHTTHVECVVLMSRIER